MQRLAIILILYFSVFSNLFGQGVKPSSEVKLFYKAEYSGGGFIHSNGFGGVFRYGKHLTGKSKVIYTAELLNMRHPKQRKSYNQMVDNAKGFYFGKLNSLMTLRLSTGQQRAIALKEVKNGVQVSFVYAAGLSLGFLTPVYLEIIEDAPGTGSAAINTEKYQPEKHNLNNILGRAQFTYGLTDMSLYPGGNVRIALNFEYAPEDDRVKALETGLVVDGFHKPVPLMHATQNYQFWYTFYVKFIFGKKIL
jgi:hypothetical protein